MVEYIGFTRNKSHAFFIFALNPTDRMQNDIMLFPMCSIKLL